MSIHFLPLLSTLMPRPPSFCPPQGYNSTGSRNPRNLNPTHPISLFARNNTNSTFEMSHTDHDTGNTGGGNNNTMTMMHTSFHVSRDTPLYGATWSPKGDEKRYVAFCLFLVILAVVFRGLMAWKAALEENWMEQDKKRVVIVAGDAVAEVDGKGDTTSESSSGSSKTIPWRFSRDIPRACMTTVNVFVGYLLYV